MDFDRGRVERKCLDPDAHNLLQLQFFKHPVEHPIFRPAIHARVDGVPIAELPGQPAPFAPVFKHVEQGIEQLQIA